MGGTYGTYEGEEKGARLIFVQECERHRPGAGVWEWIQLRESTVQ